MEQDVYADLLFLINFSMDYLCLYVCAKIMRRKIRLSRMLTASAIGGIYSVISLFLPHIPTIELLTDVLVCLIMCAVVFSEKGRKPSSTFLCTFLFVGISMMTGGCMTAIFNLLNRLDLPLDNIDSDGISTYLFAIIAAVAGIISLRSGELISHRSTIKECKLTVSMGEKSLILQALSDSGNLVRDPISGKSVIIIDRAELSKIINVSAFDKYLLGEPPDVSIRGLRLIPINTASGKGMLCAAVPDNVSAEIVTKKNKTINLELDVLISPSDIKNSAEGYGAIIPAEILKEY